MEPQESMSSPLPCLVPSYFLLLRLGWWVAGNPDIAGGPITIFSLLAHRCPPAPCKNNTPALTLGLWPLFPQ